MYKYLLCWRYLRTRYIALASMVSVMLGVATMIVVNSVMAGFSEKMRDRLHGVLADVIVESYDLDGFCDSDEVMARIKSVAGDEVEAMAPTMETFGLMKFQFGGQPITRQVQIIGIRPEERAKTGDFAEFLIDGKRETTAATGRSRRRSRSPSRSSANTPAGQLLERRDPMTTFNQVLQQDARRSRPDHGAIIGYALGHDPPRRDQDGPVHRPARARRSAWSSPRRASKPEPGYDDVHGRRLLQERDERVRLDPRLRPARAAPGDAAAGRRRGTGAVNQIQVKVKPGVDLDELAVEAPDGPGAAPPDVLPGLDLGAEARAAAGGGGGRAEHPEHAPVLHHRRGRVRHPGDLLDDRGREDPRHRRHEGARGLDRRASGGSSSATACAWASSAAASGWPAGCCSSATSTRSRSG